MNKEENPLHYKFTKQLLEQCNSTSRAYSFIGDDWTMRLNTETLYHLKNETQAIYTFFRSNWRQGEETWRGIPIKVDNTLMVCEAVFEYKQ